MGEDARIDGGFEVFFEASPECDFVDLMELAIDEWLREFNPGG